MCFPQPSLHFAPGSDDGRIHVSFDGLGRILETPLFWPKHFFIVWLFLPHPPLSSFILPQPPPLMALILACLDPTGLPNSVRHFCTQILRRVHQRCNIKHAIPFIQCLAHLASSENNFFLNGGLSSLESRGYFLFLCILCIQHSIDSLLLLL